MVHLFLLFIMLDSLISTYIVIVCSKYESHRKDGKVHHKDSFQDFQEQTNDAWDDGDDDLISLSSAKPKKPYVSRTLPNNHAVEVPTTNKMVKNSTQNSQSTASGLTAEDRICEIKEALSRSSSGKQGQVFVFIASAFNPFATSVSL